ncbi:DNA methyltransferase [Brachyspira pilosicoli]|uniref:Methyltransferase n=1 Tax=Brachyspira pilosicoli TaxID=52584 RepID=A0A5C8EPH0_BRAPL|nr:DNA methyltransferase [Brachyspira pilosicoli]TXJ39867.1 site-specific DNA-methyltransferase [Brachyspira pilosicoli]
MISHKIILGDSRYLSKIEDKSVQLIITSPPYWQLKDYGSENQIGFNDSYEEYINNLNLVWKECYRILSDGCRLCINIGDQFARSVYYGRYKVIPIRTEIIRFCETLGMDYMGAIIWQKNTTMNTSGGGSVMGSFPYPRNGILKIDYEFILIFKKLGNAPKPTREQKEESVLSKEEWNTYFASHWTFGGTKQNEHIAMFPEELPRRLIKMFSFINETVFDPFAGSGTTLLAAKNLGRNSIGYEINKNFIPIIKNKLNVEQNDLNNKFIFDIDNDSENFEKDLPYIFQDPHKMDKKIDIKKIQFGSKIDNKKIEEEKFFQVKNIISPNKIEIDNNIVIKLIGIKPIKKFEKEAIEFLEDKLKKRKIFLKYDSLKYDNDNNMLCYIYLKNKTFINRHLIKTGYVDVERESDYIYKKSFLSLLNIN